MVCVSSKTTTITKPNRCGAHRLYGIVYGEACDGRFTFSLFPPKNSLYIYNIRVFIDGDFTPFLLTPFHFSSVFIHRFVLLFFFKWGNHPIRRQFLIFMCTTMRFQVGSSATLPLTLTPAPPYHYTLPLSNYLTTSRHYILYNM